MIPTCYWQIIFMVGVASVYAVPKDFECSWRHSALKFAKTLQPDLAGEDLALLASSLTTSSSGLDCKVSNTNNGVVGSDVPARPGRMTRAGAYENAAASANVEGAATFYVAPSKDGGAG